MATAAATAPARGVLLVLLCVIALLCSLPAANATCSTTIVKKLCLKRTGECKWTGGRKTRGNFCRPIGPLPTSAPAPPTASSECDDANALGRFGPSQAMCPPGCKWTKRVTRGKRTIKNAICEDMPPAPTTCAEANDQKSSKEVCEAIAGGCLFTPAKKRGRRTIRPASCSEIPPPEEMPWMRCTYEHGKCVTFGNSVAVVRFGAVAPGAPFVTLGEVFQGKDDTPIACTAESFGVGADAYAKASEGSEGFVCQYAKRKTSSALTTFGQGGDVMSLTRPSIIRYTVGDTVFGVHRLYDTGDVIECTPSNFAAPADTSTTGRCTGWDWVEPDDDNEGAPLTYFDKSADTKLVLTGGGIATGPLGPKLGVLSPEACARQCLGEPTCKSFTYQNKENPRKNKRDGTCYASAYTADSSAEAATRRVPRRANLAFDYYELDRAKWTAAEAAQVPKWCSSTELQVPLKDLRAMFARNSDSLSGLDLCTRWREMRPGSMRGCGLENEAGTVAAECGFCAFTPLVEGSDSFKCNKLKFADAEAVCAQHGARLCTAEEIMGGAGRGTGCGLNVAPLWITGKSSVCGNNKEGLILGGGYIPFRGSPGGCAKTNSKRNFRCCQPPAVASKAKVKSVFVSSPNAAMSPESAVVELAGASSSSATTEARIPIRVKLPSNGASFTLQPLDVLFLQDLSGSFRDDLPVLRSQVPKIIAGVKEQTKDVQLGLASFVDKPVGSFGASSDYVYRLHSALSKSTTSFQREIDRLQVLNGGDGPESSLEALMMAAIRTSETGWRSKAKRVVIVATDAPYHKQGDHSSSGQNNYDEVLDGKPAGTGEDYPSEARVGQILANAGIVPVFLVANCGTTCYSSYEELVTTWGNGHVLPLASDSNNIVALLKTALTEILSDVTLSVADDEGNVVGSLTATDCGSGTTSGATTCSGLRAGDTVNFVLAFKRKAPADLKAGATVRIVSFPDFGTLNVAVQGGHC